MSNSGQVVNRPQSLRSATKMDKELHSESVNKANPMHGPPTQEEDKLSFFSFLPFSKHIELESEQPTKEHIETAKIRSPKQTEKSSTDPITIDEVGPPKAYHLSPRSNISRLIKDAETVYIPAKWPGSPRQQIIEGDAIETATPASLGLGNSAMVRTKARTLPTSSNAPSNPHSLNTSVEPQRTKPSISADDAAFSSRQGRKAKSGVSARDPVSGTRAAAQSISEGEKVSKNAPGKGLRDALKDPGSIDSAATRSPADKSFAAGPPKNGNSEFDGEAATRTNTEANPTSSKATVEAPTSPHDRKEVTASVDQGTRTISAKEVQVRCLSDEELVSRAEKSESVATTTNTLITHGENVHKTPTGPVEKADSNTKPIQAKGTEPVTEKPQGSQMASLASTLFLGLPEWEILQTVDRQFRDPIVNGWEWAKDSLASLFGILRYIFGSVAKQLFGMLITAVVYLIYGLGVISIAALVVSSAVLVLLDIVHTIMCQVPFTITVLPNFCPVGELMIVQLPCSLPILGHFPLCPVPPGRQVAQDGLDISAPMLRLPDTQTDYWDDYSKHASNIKAYDGDVRRMALNGPLLELENTLSDNRVPDKDKLRGMLRELRHKNGDLVEAITVVALRYESLATRAEDATLTVMADLKGIAERAKLDIVDTLGNYLKQLFPRSALAQLGIVPARINNTELYEALEAHYQRRYKDLDIVTEYLERIRQVLATAQNTLDTMSGISRQTERQLQGKQTAVAERSGSYMQGMQTLLSLVNPDAVTLRRQLDHIKGLIGGYVYLSQEIGGMDLDMRAIDAEKKEMRAYLDEFKDDIDKTKAIDGEDKYSLQHVERALKHLDHLTIKGREKMNTVAKKHIEDIPLIEE